MSLLDPLSVSAQLFRLTHLEDLRCSHNRLTKIPTAICNLRNLRYLSLDYNYIAEIPVEISALTRTFHIPSSFAICNRVTVLICSVLHELHLDYNRIRVLPLEILALTCT